jgi:hypothetical protein
MATLNDMIRTLERIGVADVILPFILVFTVIYAVLRKSQILGEDNDKFNVMVALVMGMGVIFPHVTGNGPDVVVVINNALPNVAAVAIAIIMLFILLGVWGEKMSIIGTPLASWAVLFSIGAIVYIFGASAGWGWDVPNGLRFLLDSDTQALLITILIFGIIVSYITREPNQEKEGRFSKSFKDLGGLFKE